MGFSCNKWGFDQDEIHEVLNQGEDKIDMIQMRPIYILNNVSLKNDDYLKLKIMQK